jgi:hypothetical protein
VGDKVYEIRTKQMTFSSVTLAHLVGRGLLRCALSSHPHDGLVQVLADHRPEDGRPEAENAFVGRDQAIAHIPLSYQSLIEERRRSEGRVRTHNYSTKILSMTTPERVLAAVGFPSEEDLPSPRRVLGNHRV